MKNSIFVTISVCDMQFPFSHFSHLTLRPMFDIQSTWSPVCIIYMSYFCGIQLGFHWMTVFFCVIPGW